MVRVCVRVRACGWWVGASLLDLAFDDAAQILVLGEDLPCEWRREGEGVCLWGSLLERARHLRCCATLCDAVLCYAMLCYAMLFWEGFGGFF